MVYLPFNNKPPFATYFLVRTTNDPHSLTEEIRKAIWSYNPNVTIARIHTLDSQISDSLAPEHLQTIIFAAFGAAALLLALLGIYGTLSYSVSARTQEVGIRMAVGATRQSIYKLMLGTVVLPVGLGLTLGCLASLSHWPKSRFITLWNETDRPIRNRPCRMHLRYRRSRRDLRALQTRRQRRTDGGIENGIAETRPAQRFL